MTARTNRGSAAAAMGPATAIRFLASRGYETTTAEDLADAIGVSRSTFFRRYGSKDDVIFADHDLALKNLEADLAATTLPPAEALITATCDVLRLLIRDPEAAQLRFQLVRQHPQLKERELVITHRYERVFMRYLRTHLPAHAPEWAAASFAASLVALHNQTLRVWLRDGLVDAPEVLRAHLSEVAAMHGAWLSAPVTGAKSMQAQGARPQGTGSSVVVAVYETGGSPEEVLAAVSAQLSK